MTSMIENLIGSSIRRHDRKLLVGAKRMAPSKPRDLFDLMIALGRQTTLQGIWQSADWSNIDPRQLVFAILNRWPSTAELEALPADYDPRMHLRQILTSEEFRHHLARRLCDTYPERPRQLYIHIPRCAGRHFLKTIDVSHPLFPDQLIETLPKDSVEFVVALGCYLARFTETRTILIAQARLAPFIDTPEARWTEGDSLSWNLNAPVRRGGDRLFTILRDPREILLSRVNAILTSLRNPATTDEAAAAKLWNFRLGDRLPKDDMRAWQDLGVEILAELADQNPICHALGDGTASSALEACQTSNIEIADLSRYQQWLRDSWDVAPEAQPRVAEPVLTLDQLTNAQHDLVADRTAQDRIFYARLTAAMQETSDPAVKGAAL